METFKVRITETLEKVVEVQAVDAKNALEITHEKYTAAEDDFVLSADDYSGVNFKVEKEC